MVHKWIILNTDWQSQNVPASLLRAKVNTIRVSITQLPKLKMQAIA